MMSPFVIIARYMQMQFHRVQHFLGFFFQINNIIQEPTFKDI